MNDETTIRQDRWVRQDRLILELIGNGEKRFKELWDAVGVKNGKRQKWYFGSKRDLHDALIRLIKRGDIKERVRSRKNKSYLLSKDAKELMRLVGTFSECDRIFPEVLRQVSAGKQNLDSSYAYANNVTLIRMELANFLETLSTWVSTEPKWQEFVKWSLIRYNVEFFGRLLAEMGKAHPEVMDRCIEDVTNSLRDK